MKNKPLTILISIALLLLGGLTTSLHAKSGIIYGTDKLSSSRTLCVVQDKYGFIWIGTENGLNCYDGYHFRSYTHSAKDPRSLCGIDVITMLVSKNHELWIGTGSGVCRYNYATDDFEKIGVENTIDSVFIISRAVLECDLDLHIHRNLNEVFVICSAVAGFVYRKYSIEFFPFLNCVKLSHLNNPFLL